MLRFNNAQILKKKTQKKIQKKKGTGPPIHHAWVCGGWSAPIGVVHRRPLGAQMYLKLHIAHFLKI
jgi:hypothetical protein